MGKITIEFEGDFKFDQIKEEVNVTSGINNTRSMSYPTNIEHVLIMPQNSKVKVKIHEDEIHKETTINNITLKIDSHVNSNKLADDLVKAIKNNFKHVNIK